MSRQQHCLEVVSEDNITILDLEGEIDIATATEFKELMLRSIDDGARRVVVDLTKVTFIDSSGLSVLVGGERRLRPLGGSLVVACGSDMRRLLQVTGLAKAFPVSETRDEALQTWRGGDEGAGSTPLDPI